MNSDSVQFLQYNISRFVEFVDIIRNLEKDGLYIRIDDFTIISTDMARRSNFVNTLVIQSPTDLHTKTSMNRSRSRSRSPIASNYMSTQPSSSSSSSGALRVRIMNELVSSPSPATTHLPSDDSDDESDDINETATVGENDDTIVFPSSQWNTESPESPPPQSPYDDDDSPESPPVSQWHQIVDYPYREFAPPSHTYEGYSVEDIVYSIGIGKDHCDAYTSRVRLERAETIEEGARAECVIFLDVTAFPNVTYINCGHMFCLTCIRQWQKPCPVCRSSFNVSVGRI